MKSLTTLQKFNFRDLTIANYGTQCVQQMAHVPATKKPGLSLTRLPLFPNIKSLEHLNEASRVYGVADPKP